MSELTLDSVDWGIFRLKEIFDIENCKCSKVSGLKEGNIPYVGATNQNNGTVSYLYNYPHLITKGNCLVFICDGEGSMGFSFYKEADFIGTTTVKVGRNKNLNKFNGMFISTVADTVRGKYNFGYKRNELRLKNETLTLPISSEGSPNWKFMEDYTKQELKLQSQKVSNYFQNKLIKLGDEQTPLEIEWRAFWMEELIDISPGVRLTKTDQIAGDIPFIGATDSNNGITEFVGNINNSIDNNVLGVNYNGSVVENFYHSYECIFSDDVKRIKFKNKKYGDEFTYLFLKQLILSQKSKYQYGYKFNTKRMNRQKIMLPIDENGDPNWQYMSNFIKNLEKENIERIIEYLNLYNQ